MKGVKINNYIDNRIVVSDPKINNQIKVLNPNTYILKNITFYQHQSPNKSKVRTHEPVSKSPESKSHHKKKKINLQNFICKTQEQNKQNGVKQNKYFDQKCSPNKKPSLSSSPSQNHDQQLNSTLKKRKFSSKSIGFTNRNKSSNKKCAIASQMLFDSGQKVHSKTNMEINLAKKKIDSGKKKKLKLQKSSQKIDSCKKMKKNNSYLNMKDKNEAKTSRKGSKSFVSSSKKTKTTSARDNFQKQTFFNTKNSQSAHKTFKKQHIFLEQFLNTNRNDLKLQDAIRKLQSAIKSKSNKDPIGKIQYLVKKLEQIQDNFSSKEEEQIKENKNIKTEQVFAKIQSSPSSCSEQDVDEGEYEQEQTNQNLSGEKFTNVEMILNKECKEKYENIRQQWFEKRREEMQFFSENKETRGLRHSHQHDNDAVEMAGKQQNPLIGRKNVVHHYFNIVDYDSVNSMKSDEENNQLYEILELKKFQQQSNLMMKKVKQIDERKVLNLNKKGQSDGQTQNSVKQMYQNNEMALSPLSHEPVSTGAMKQCIQKEPEPKENSKYWLQKYPKQRVKSPLICSSQIEQVIKVRQRIFYDRNSKLNELVNVMYNKQIVSPKTYKLQISSLKQKEEENNTIIHQYKKHAQELTKLIEEIKYEKEQIHSIDDIIRKQSWDHAINFIKSNPNQKQPKPLFEFPKQLTSSQVSKQLLPNLAHFENDSQDDEESEISQSGFKLVLEQQIQKQQLNAQIQNFDENKEQKWSEQPKYCGFESTLFFIKEYCIDFCQFIRDKHLKEVKQTLSQPNSYNLPKLLQSFRVTTNNLPAKSLNSLYEDLLYPYTNFHNSVLPISQHIFNQFNKQYAPIKFYGKQVSVNADLEGIFLTSLFNALNQSMNFEKPGGMHGEPLPWAISSQHLKNVHTMNSQKCENKDEQSSLDISFGRSIARMIEWGSCLCGFIADTAQLQNTMVDQQYIRQIRQTRAAVLLSKMLIEQDKQINRIQLQLTEVRLSIAEIVYQSMIDQFCGDILIPLF